MSDPHSQEEIKNSSLKRRTLLWIIAIIIMFAAIVYQKRTGPTYPMRGEYKIAEKQYRYKLIRSEWTTTDAKVILPKTEVKPALYYRRYKVDEPFTQVVVKEEKQNDKELWVGHLPKQPAAGKLEYYLELKTDKQNIRIPENAQENIIIRFKDPVPGYILWPHIIMMFFSVLIGMRAGLGAIFAPDTMRSSVWIALIGMTIGGMTLGPVVQKYAFGEYWTGFPFGGDWTDNKMLVMWGVWLIAAAAIGLKEKKKELPGRIMVVIAAIVMTIVYLIPHSMHGSELDYSKVKEGVDPKKAIKTGR